MTHFHFIALGANLSGRDGLPPRVACEWAASALAGLPGVTAACRSRWYSTAPMPPSDQPRYINGVIRLVGILQPCVLLQSCQAIEARAGRVRSARDAARTLDVDIIDMGGQVHMAPDPILPHPRAHLRAFVLLPLRDVAPSWAHPSSGVSISALIAALPPQDIRPC